jgi:hypothetical protein
MADDLKEIQEDLIDYFKDLDDTTFIDVIDILVYHKGTSDVNISTIAHKFLEDNGLHEAYINYLGELKKTDIMFVSHPTDIRMIEQIKQSLLSISHNRFRASNNSNGGAKPVKKTPMSPLYRLSKGEKKDLTLLIGDCERQNDDNIEDEDSTREMFGEDATEIIAERKRLSKLFTKVLTILK